MLGEFRRLNRGRQHLGSHWAVTEPAQEVESHQDPKVFSIMADVILSCEAPTEGKVSPS